MNGLKGVWNLMLNCVCVCMHTHLCSGQRLCHVDQTFKIDCNSSKVKNFWFVGLLGSISEIRSVLTNWGHIYCMSSTARDTHWTPDPQTQKTPAFIRLVLWLVRLLPVPCTQHTSETMLNQVRTGTKRWSVGVAESLFQCYWHKPSKCPRNHLNFTPRMHLTLEVE